MKRLVLAWPGRLLLATLLLLLACRRQEAGPTDYTLVYPEYRPVFMTRATMEDAVAVLPPQALRNTGKIYLLGDYLFINEKYQGVHIIDNRDPARPRPVSFVRIPGNIDMAVQGSLLYADSGPDLLTVDIADPAHAHLLSRTRDAFRELPMPVAGMLEEACRPGNRPANAVVVGWRKLAPGEGVPVRQYNVRGLATATLNNPAANYSATRASGEEGKGGSLARFAVMGRTMYAVDDYSLRVFDLRTPTTPVAGKIVPVGFGIETIFPRDNYLFLGSQTGMFVYDVTTPDAPKWVSSISHLRSCDPVVVDGNYAYVTLRSTAEGSAGTLGASSIRMFSCGSSQTNQLDVVDLSTLSQPRLVRTYPMSGPLGLGAENNRLYVCDDGLKIFDTSHAPVLTQLQRVAVRLTDVIPNGDYLLGIGPDGLYQYEVSGTTVRQVSLLPVTPDA